MTGTKALPQDATIALYVALALLAIFARTLGELARKIKQPAILGEIIAGVLLGKTVFGRIWPQGWNYVFGPGLSATAISAVASLAATLFMLVSGLEMDLDRLLSKKERRKPLIVGFCSVAVPFVLGFGITYAAPQALGAMPGQNPTTYALFAGTAMSITAMPVVAKTLRDVGLFRSDLGRIVMSSATVDDLLGWSLFAVVLALSDPRDQSLPQIGIGGTIGLCVVFVFFTVIFGRLCFPRFFLWIQARFSFPGGIMGFVMGWTMTCAALATFIGLHNTLAGFLVGASISNNRHLRHRVREVIDQFVTYFLAPIFFGYIAVNADFVANFDISLIVIVFVIACAGKITGATIGARLSGSPWREAISVATCMNSRGAMEILLANVALSANIIDGRMFVALVLMAILTSLLPGPVLRRILRRKERKTFTHYMPYPQGFVPDLAATDADGAIRELCKRIEQTDCAEALVEQQHSFPCGNQEQLAIVKCEFESVRKPIIVLGVAKFGINFSGEIPVEAAEDEQNLAHIVALLLLPKVVPGTANNFDITLESDICQQLSMVFARNTFRAEVYQAKTFMELQSLVKFEVHRLGLHSAMEETATAIIPSQLVGRPGVQDGNGNGTHPDDDLKSQASSHNGGAPANASSPSSRPQEETGGHQQGLTNALSIV